MANRLPLRIGSLGIGPLRIGIVAGELSGDLLGADLMRAIRRRHPDAGFEGIGGPEMIAEGFRSLFPIERLSVMGLVEPLKRLPELLRIRRQLHAHFSAQPPALLLGIDAPDFTLSLEAALRRRGVLTAHYVSPSVWAWRRWRLHGIARAVDHMLTLFPFEEAFYREHGIPVTCVGHPLADRIGRDGSGQEHNREAARAQLGCLGEGRVVALLPGSRADEVARLAPPFLATARWLLARDPQLRFLLPAANAERASQLRPLLSALPGDFPLRLLDGQARLAMAAADAVMLASGTASLEALLLDKPMVVAYRLGWLSHALMARLVKTPYIALPNLLAGRELVPELLQGEVRAELLGPLLMRCFADAAGRRAQSEAFGRIHAELARDASERAADCLLGLIANSHNKHG